ncbi:unnamed protein product [Heterotrigona itama]|uniref:Uncharacterized protein n=1 Tax=Heterotrigona itama TaxID=395501 RepID=A0A6V7GUD8_9HYME|nr:unnamed protein product [Heterotrigona itama]
MNVEEKSEQEHEIGSLKFTKENWIKKLGNYSPCQVPTSLIRTNAMKAVDRSGLCDTYEATTQQTISGSSQAPLEESNLENIIREFEIGFLSPSKQDRAIYKKKNFVKKIVAAFEVKYKTATGESHEENKSHIVESPRKNGIFSSPYKSNFEVSESFEKFSPLKQNGKNSDESGNVSKNDSTIFKTRSGIFDSPYKSEDEKVIDILPDISKDETKEVKRKSSKESGIFSSLFNCNDSKSVSLSEIRSSSSSLDLKHESSKDFSDFPILFKFDKEDSSEGANFHFSSMVSCLDETKTIDNIDLDVTSPDNVFVADIAFPKTSTMINKFSKDKDDSVIDKFSKDKDDSVIPEISCVDTDRTPKIVGAFLKEPIEVEDTSINWIPIIGKKLPRKRSLKKLLYSLTGKKLNKKDKLFCSEINLSEELREFQDSGYEEKSCSSSSLTSRISFTEVQQENSYIESNRRSTFETFKPRNKSNKEENEVFCYTNHSSRVQNKKLILIEVPREEVKLDLGPCYPPLSMITSLNRKMMAEKPSSPPAVYEFSTKLSKHAYVSKIPKHPFVSLLKMDESLEFSHKYRNSYDSLSVIIKNDLYEVEFRRSCDNLLSSTSCRNFSSTASEYDVPRRFLSDNEILSIRQSILNSKEEPIYDVPKPQGIERPRPSVYEDVTFLKRSAQMKVHDDFKFHYFEPRDSKIYFNDNKMRSLDDLTSKEKSSVF